MENCYENIHVDNNHKEHFLNDLLVSIGAFRVHKPYALEWQTALKTLYLTEIFTSIG